VTDSDNHRARRYSFVAGILVTDLATEKQLSAHTQELSSFGCFVETVKPFAENAKVRARITRSGMHLVAQGRVTHSLPNVGMGIVFTSFESGSLSILELWLTDLRNRHSIVT
jgi:hypothetical protein